MKSLLIGGTCPKLGQLVLPPFTKLLSASAFSPFWGCAPMSWSLITGRTVIVLQDCDCPPGQADATFALPPPPDLFDLCCPS